jgi:hypothetical protein
MERKVRPDFVNQARFKEMTNFEKQLELMRVADLVPHLVGSKGIGKSSKVKNFAKRMQMAYVKVEFSNVDRVDFNGLLKFEEYIKDSGNEVYDKVIEYMNTQGDRNHDSNSLAYHTHTIPKWVVEVLENHAKGIPTLLFFDEINRAPTDVINAIMNTILEREYGSDRMVLPATTFIVSAGNPDTEDYTVSEMDQAVKGRVVELEMGADFEEWKKNFANGFTTGELLEAEKVPEKETDVDLAIHPTVIQYLEEYPREFLMDGIENDNGDKSAGLDPRRWEMISNLFKSFELLVPENDSKKYMGLLRGTLDSLSGVDVSSKLFAYYKDNKVINLEKLLKRVDNDLAKLKPATEKNPTPMKAIADKTKQLFDSLEVVQKKNIFDNMVDRYANGKMNDKQLALMLNIMPTEFLVQIADVKADDKNIVKVQKAMEKLDSEYNLDVYTRLTSSITETTGLDDLLLDNLLDEDQKKN